MSINTLTNAALARRKDFEPSDRVPRSLSEIADAAARVPRPLGAGEANDVATTALQTLTTYLPSEVLTLYVAAVAAIGPITVLINETPVDFGRWIPFWSFLALTPILVWISFATKLKAQEKALPLSPRLWPIWEMIAASIAFVAWAAALPNTPFATANWYSSGLASFLVLVVSAGLGAVAPLMQRELAS